MSNKSIKQASSLALGQIMKLVYLQSQ